MTKIRLPYASGKVRLSSPFGNRVLNGLVQFHAGVDLVGEDTKQIVAPVSGAVLRSRIVTDYSDLTWQWGNYVCILGSDGIYYYFCHLSERCVEAYQHVSAGDLIGVEGNTGYSFGSHLHFEVRTSAGSGAFNPCGLIGFDNEEGETHMVEDTIDTTTASEKRAIAEGCHDWSKDAVVWALDNDILKGDGASLNLSSTLTREEMIVILYRVYSTICGDDGK